MSKKPKSKPEDVMAGFNELFDIIVLEFGQFMDDDIGLMFIMIDFREKQSYLNYKGRGGKERAHQLLREYLDRQ